MPSVLAVALALQDREAEEMLRAAGGWCPLNPLFSPALEIEPKKRHFHAFWRVIYNYIQQ